MMHGSIISRTIKFKTLTVHTNQTVINVILFEKKKMS
jgi:hypothetical protein